MIYVKIWPHTWTPFNLLSIWKHLNGISHPKPIQYPNTQWKELEERRGHAARAMQKMVPMSRSLMHIMSNMVWLHQPCCNICFLSRCEKQKIASSTELIDRRNEWNGGPLNRNSFGGINNNSSLEGMKGKGGQAEGEGGEALVSDVIYAATADQAATRSTRFYS